MSGVDMVFNPGGGQEVRALEGIDLEVGRGGFISLIGPSGCGKSTLLRLVGGLISPTAGLVEVNGKDTTAARLDREYGMVFQTAHPAGVAEGEGQRGAAPGDNGKGQARAP